VAESHAFRDRRVGTGQALLNIQGAKQIKNVSTKDSVEWSTETGNVEFSIAQVNSNSSQLQRTHRGQSSYGVLDLRKILADPAWHRICCKTG
jgi:hypothetical protein